MTFIFFDAADAVLFARNDAEQAEHNHQEMTLYALFPYDPNKVLQQGQRVGFEDSLGVFQVFEIIKAKTYEPDHYQEITAEHIAIAELHDDLYTGGDLMDKTPAQALTAILDGTLWSVGNSTATNTSSVKLSFGDTWEDVRKVEQNWNVYITPRVTIDSTGITGRYLDIAPAEGAWRGLRLALEKNLDDASVIWDSTRLKTALYGYGKKSMTVPGEDEQQPWTFASVTWAATADHPAKPAGQIYLEDTAATAEYGRNGRPRFGYYQNGDVDDPEKLLELTWETLKTVEVPDVTIEGTALDLTKFGAPDVPIRLHDLALVEIRPTGVVLHKEIIQYTENLLQPEISRVTIGTYIPNIVYITRETANGRGGGGGSGGQTDEEYKLKEFETELGWNDYQISLKAWQRDLDKTDENLLLAYAAIGISSSEIQSIVTGSGVQLDQYGNIVTDSNGLPVFAPGSSQMWTTIDQQKDQIALVVTGTGANAAVNVASIVAAVNAAGSSVTINADKIYLNGHTLVTEISGLEADFSNLTSGTATATALKASLLQATNNFTLGSTSFKSTPISMGSIISYTGMTSSNASVDLNHSHSITMTESSGVVTATLGAAVMTTASSRIANFSIADTAFYQNAVSAASAQGYRDAANAVRFPDSGVASQMYVTYPNTAGSTTQKGFYLTQGSWSSGSRTISLRRESTSGAIVAQTTVNMPASGTWNIYNYAGVYLGESIYVSLTVGGKKYETSAVI